MSDQQTQHTYVIGTAGHVDHGKSTLVRALTGIDPDRLQEEKDRQLTIDLGFAWLDLPGDLSVSIVDVPGHERFIKNMLAGVGGIDAAMLIVAADEGPMPQTREHLAILDLLGISAGLVVITKADLVDQEWLDLVQEETREELAGTVLAEASIITVSATKGDGLDEVRETLAAILASNPEHRLRGNARLPVDRVFSVAGFGTVVTGTLLGSDLEIGQDVEVLPGQLKGRVRGLQSHGQQVDRANPGSRTAINISGVGRDEIQRGDVVARPGWLMPTELIDVRLRLLPSAPRPLEQNDPIDFFSGASERQAFVTLLDTEQIQPGEEAWVQIRFNQPIVGAEGDLFIIRQASPSLTIGGGTIINPHPRRHRRFRERVISELETRATGSPADRLAQLLESAPTSVTALAKQLELDPAEMLAAAGEVVESGRARWLRTDSDAPQPSDYLIAEADYDRLTSTVVDLLEDYHRRRPLRFGMPREEVRSRLNLGAWVFDALITCLQQDGVVDDRGEVLARAGHEIQLSDSQQSEIDRYLRALDSAPYSPPSPDEIGIDVRLLPILETQSKVVRLSDTVVFASHHFEKMRDETLSLIDEHEQITLAQFRDHFGSSRKYAQAVLEYFDERRITRRVGDARVRGNG